MNRLLLSILLILVGGSAEAAAEEAAPRVMSFVYNRNQSDLDGVDRYVWRVLDLALRRTRGRYGDYRLVSVPTMPTHRRAYTLEHGLEGVTVGLFSDNAEREKSLVPVRIPVDRGLTGYRLLLIQSADQPHFSAVTGPAELQKFRFGLLPWWDDDAVMRRAGLPVVPGVSYQGLFQMLAAHRFDALSRSAREVLPEYEKMKSAMPGLAVEKHLVLHYPMPVYFWFRDDGEGRRRAERVKAGLEQMVADGTLKKMFDAEFGSSLARLDLAHRLVVELPNPLLDAKTLPENPALWYRPWSN